MNPAGRSVVSVSGKDARVYISRGDANTLLGQGREALDNYRRAVNLSPMTPEVRRRCLAFYSLSAKY